MFNMPQFNNAAKVLLVGWIFYVILKSLWDEAGMRVAYLPSTFGLIVLVFTIVYVARNFYQNQDDNEEGAKNRDTGSDEATRWYHLLIGRLVVISIILGILWVSYLVWG